MTRTGSVAVKKKITTSYTWDDLIDRGEPVVNVPGRPDFALFNANPFNYGIANLGAQAIARYLSERGVNVYFAFADSMGSHAFINDPHKAPADCDVIGISIPFEDTYLGALGMLDRAGLPIHARDRADDAPLVVLGGLAMINPIPFSEFADVIVVGEGREAIHEIVTRYVAARREGCSKQSALFDIAGIPGAYVPSHYELEIDEDGYVTSFDCHNGHPTVESNIPLDPNVEPVFSAWTSRFASYTQEDYFSVMAAFGCHKKCPFCVVGHVQGARSGRAMAMDSETILALAEERRARYGTRLVKIFFSSAFSPGEGDINSSAIKGLLAEMHRRGFSCRVGSLNVKQADAELFELVAATGQTEVTFAPESTERLRRGLGKTYISDEKLHSLASMAGRYGLALNVYSLGSLPGETDDDTREYARLLRALRKSLGRGKELFVHYNPAFMKAQTPFQYLGNARPEEARRKFALLKRETEGADIEFVSVVPDAMAYYQPVLALGDLDSGRLLAHLYRTPNPTEDDWRRAMFDLGINDARYFQAKDPGGTLPWEHIAYSSHAKLKKRAAQVQRRGNVPVARQAA